MEEVRTAAAVKARAGLEYRLWVRVIEVGTDAKVYRLVERTRIPQEQDAIFNLIEFLEVLGESLGVDKAESPMDPVEFHKYVIKTLRGWAPEMKAIGDVYADKYIEMLEKEDWSKMTEKEIEAEVSKLAAWVPIEVTHATARMTSTGSRYSWQMSLATREGVINTANMDLETSFNLKETRAIERLSTWSYKQIPVSYVRMSERLSKTIQRELIKGLETGEHYKKVTAEIARKTPEIVTRQQMNFLNVTAQSALGRARSQAQLLTYRDAQVTVIRLAAVMDEATTPQCSFLNNQIIGVEPTLNYMENAVAKDEDPRNAFPWIEARKDRSTGQEFLEFTQDGKTQRFAEKAPGGEMKYREGWNLEKLIPYGVGMPPYHAFCRSTTYLDIETL
ncbi:MAG: hypothetical protein Q7U75_19455 [Desulfobacterales bacterium]|nr:hypothetical protein [Desulfobacterales bacterium]